MFSSEDNELLTRTGPGTVMGDVIRQYWIPALKSSELPAPDCPPVRIRLLSENLVAFRTTSGKVGLIDAYCPHRRTELFLGRNEEEGLRCIFHGWKWDINGICVDMPSEPLETNFTTKVHAKAYPCVERGGVVWTYMGPRHELPPLPDIEPNMLPASKEIEVQPMLLDCNWFQVLENGLDTVHTAFLHNGSIPPSDADKSDITSRSTGGEILKYVVGQRAIKIVSEDTEYGCRYAAYRPAEETTYLWRMACFMFPFYHIGPTNQLGTGTRVIAHVPVDDTHSMSWGWYWHPGANRSPRKNLLPNSTAYLGRFRPVVLKEDDYDQDRELQRSDRTFKGFSGIPVFADQDRAVTELQGDIADRTQEHLGSIDGMIVRTRRRVIQEVRKFSEEGKTPPGVDNPDVYRVRGGWTLLPRTADVWEATATLCRSVEIDDQQPTESEPLLAPFIT